MVSLVVLFGILIVLFAVIGASRGWAKELLVTSSIILALFIIQILETHIRPYYTALVMQPPGTQFLVRGLMVSLLAFFGYQTPHIRALQPKLVRERLQDVLLGIFMGALNGYLLFGSLWYYLDQSGYPTQLIQMPEQGTQLAEQISNIVQLLPPQILPIPQLYFAVGVVFVFIIVVFV
ncbi:MAG: CvpA family protein [Anaerolineales bacterium]|jgi:uncharacterized membrane protein required for colicin V production